MACREEEELSSDVFGTRNIIHVYPGYLQQLHGKMGLGQVEQ